MCRCVFSSKLNILNLPVSISFQHIIIGDDVKRFYDSFLSFNEIPSSNVHFTEKKYFFTRFSFHEDFVNQYIDRIFASYSVEQLMYFGVVISGHLACGLLGNIGYSRFDSSYLTLYLIDSNTDLTDQTEIVQVQAFLKTL